MDANVLAYIIRRANNDDIEAIGTLWEELVAYHVALDSRLPPSVANGGKRYARRLYDKVNDPYACLLVAECDREVVGYVLGMIVDLPTDMFDQAPTGFLADIFVSSAHRAQGIGRSFVQELTLWFTERGVTSYEWHVAANNTDALAFWRRVGGQDLMIRMRVEISGHKS
jgi:ribosomal protein S18 acetylase RimI-like enzyme